MVYKYVVVLKNQQNKYIDVLGIILSLFSVLCFINEIIVEQQINYACLLGSIAIILLLAWNIRRSFQKKKAHYNYSLYIAALVWMKMPYFNWLVLVFIILGFLEHQAKYSIEIGFTDNEIAFNTLLKKKYKWNQFSNIILKDDIITLDFINNRLMQRQIEDDDDYEADEDEFNEYCRKQLQLTHERQ